MQSKTPHLKSMRSVPGFLAFLVVALAALILATPGCRHKDSTIVGPTDTSSTQYHIELEDTSTIYVPNDTITVHMYDQGNVLQIGRPLTFRAEFDSNRVTHWATSTSTAWGCNPPLVYSGSGGGGQDNPVEVIHAYYVDPTSRDTLAHAFRTYMVRPR